jgi:hypothetical protein
MRHANSLLGIILLLAAGSSRAADLPSPWVEFAAGGGLDVRSITAPGAACPAVMADGTETPSAPRQPPDQAYPLQVCSAHVPQTVSHLTVEGLPVPVPAKRLSRVILIGDTGCRLKGNFIRDCNDPVSWPFSTIARLAAARRPDLVIHVGDYHYRETPCPADRPGCAGSPFGDTWAVWQRDFFDPAAPLLAVAPWVMVRGNHELCNRGGQGWTRLLDPHPGGAACSAMSTPYAVDIDPLHLLILDSAIADDAKPDPATVAAYRQQLQALFANAAPHSWLVTHRPVWALTETKGVKPNATLNATLQAAIADQVPPALDMVLGGHIHDFMSFEFGPHRPAQLVTGEGGDANDPIDQPVKPGLIVDGMPLRHAFAMPDYGYVLLHRTPHGWGATVYSVTDAILARCQMHDRALNCRAVAS